MRMLDFIIRNQEVFWLSLCAIAEFALVLAAFFKKPVITLNRMPVELGRELLRRLYSPRPWVLGTVVSLLLLFVIAAFVRPIPKTTALDFPAPVRDNLHNHYLILFVHGWMGDSGETWKQFPELVMNDKRFEKCNIISLSYPTYIMRRSLSIPQLSQWLTEQMRQRDYYLRYEKICIVAHSLGGIVAREIVIENRLGNVPDRIQKLVEIATPHLGANVAGLAGAIGIERAYIRDVAPEAQYLENLRDHWNRLKPRPATFAITSKEDSIVTERSAEEQCDRYRVFPQWGHTELAKPDSSQDDRYTFAMDEVDSAFRVAGNR